ncbi:hypothetical protein [Nonomuraea sp. SBT364]|nr:hypothetical protein [Nonomuraea sp. SBT364]
MLGTGASTWLKAASSRLVTPTMTTTASSSRSPRRNARPWANRRQ